MSLHTSSVACTLTRNRSSFIIKVKAAEITTTGESLEAIHMVSE